MQTKKIVIWLYIILLLTISMVILGGYTRLTDSGLSIVEWKPIKGILPPLNETEWTMEFENYQLHPEYKIKNFDMNLAEFKSIFWVEFFHRILGRLLGLTFILPLLYFTYKNYLTRKQIFSFLDIAALIGLQGFIGWYMVRSGLSDRPDVSHFRLALHLSFALIIASLIFWNILSLSYPPKKGKINLSFVPIALLVFLQINFGAFVAGLDAGLVYNSFPLMGDSFVPGEFFINKWYEGLLSNEGKVQFLHRIMAYIIILYLLFAVIKNWGKASIIERSGLSFLLSLVFIQIFIGIFLLILKIPVILALSHQLVGILIFLSVLFVIFHQRR